jgi:hypothetical protein
MLVLHLFIKLIVSLNNICQIKRIKGLPVAKLFKIIVHNKMSFHKGGDIVKLSEYRDVSTRYNGKYQKRL